MPYVISRPTPLCKHFALPADARSIPSYGKEREASAQSIMLTENTSSLSHLRVTKVHKFVDVSSQPLYFIGLMLAAENTSALCHLLDPQVCKLVDMLPPTVASACMLPIWLQSCRTCVLAEITVIRVSRLCFFQH